MIIPVLIENLSNYPEIQAVLEQITQNLFIPEEDKAKRYNYPEIQAALAQSAKNLIIPKEVKAKRYDVTLTNQSHYADLTFFDFACLYGIPPHQIEALFTKEEIKESLSSYEYRAIRMAILNGHIKTIRYFKKTGLISDDEIKAAVRANNYEAILHAADTLDTSVVKYLLNFFGKAEKMEPLRLIIIDLCQHKRLTSILSLLRIPELQSYIERFGTDEIREALRPMDFILKNSLILLQNNRELYPLPASVIVSPISSLRACEAIQGSEHYSLDCFVPRKDEILDTGETMTEAPLPMVTEDEKLLMLQNSITSHQIITTECVDSKEGTEEACQKNKLIPMVTEDEKSLILRGFESIPVAISNDNIKIIQYAKERGLIGGGEINAAVKADDYAAIRNVVKNGDVAMVQYLWDYLNEAEKIEYLFFMINRYRNDDILFLLQNIPSLLSSTIQAYICSKNNYSKRFNLGLSLGLLMESLQRDKLLISHTVSLLNLDPKERQLIDSSDSEFEEDDASDEDSNQDWIPPWFDSSDSEEDDASDEDSEKSAEENILTAKIRKLQRGRLGPMKIVQMLLIKSDEIIEEVGGKNNYSALFSHFFSKLNNQDKKSVLMANNYEDIRIAAPNFDAGMIQYLSFYLTKTGRTKVLRTYIEVFVEMYWLGLFQKIIKTAWEVLSTDIVVGENTPMRVAYDSILQVFESRSGSGHLGSVLRVFSLINIFKEGVNDFSLFVQYLNQMLSGVMDIFTTTAIQAIPQVDIYSTEVENDTNDDYMDFVNAPEIKELFDKMSLITHGSLDRGKVIAEFLNKDADIIKDFGKINYTALFYRYFEALSYDEKTAVVRANDYLAIRTAAKNFDPAMLQYLMIYLNNTEQKKILESLIDERIDGLVEMDNKGVFQKIISTARSVASDYYRRGGFFNDSSMEEDWRNVEKTFVSQPNPSRERVLSVLLLISKIKENDKNLSIFVRYLDQVLNGVMDILSTTAIQAIQLRDDEAAHTTSYEQALV